MVAEPMNKEYVVVIRAGDRLRLAPNEELRIDFKAKEQVIALTFRTRYMDEGFDTAVPRELWIDVRGQAPSLNDAATQFTNLAMFFTTIISFCANGYAGDCRFHLAYDNTPGSKEREFFEQFVEDERGLPHPSRRIRPASITDFITTLAGHEHTMRLRRAIVQYVLALKYWSTGEEILAVAHLFMGMEALVPIIRSTEITRHGFDSTQQLADYWGIPLNGLDSKIRRDNLFQGDHECHREAKKASDGVEHGFLGFDEVRPLAISVRNNTAKYLRDAIIELLELPDDSKDDLLKSTYEKPMGTEGYIRYLRGRLLSDSDQLAAKDHKYPIVVWKFSVTSFTLNEKDEFSLSFSQQMTPILSEGTLFQPLSVEIYGPEGIVAQQQPNTPSIVEPIITPKQTDIEPMTLVDAQLLLRKMLDEADFDECIIKTKSGQVLVIKPQSNVPN